MTNKGNPTTERAEAGATGELDVDYEAFAEVLRSWGDRRVRVEVRTGVFLEIWPADDGDAFTADSGTAQVFAPGEAAGDLGSTKLVGTAKTVERMLSGLGPA